MLGRASAAGVEVQPLLPMYDLGPPVQPGIVLGYGAIPTADIDEGLGPAAALLRRLTRPLGLDWPGRRRQELALVAVPHCSYAHNHRPAKTGEESR